MTPRQRKRRVDVELGAVQSRRSVKDHVRSYRQKTRARAPTTSEKWESSHSISDLWLWCCGTQVCTEYSVDKRAIASSNQRVFEWAVNLMPTGAWWSGIDEGPIGRPSSEHDISLGHSDHVRNPRVILPLSRFS